jgi:hypothetical protein
MIGAPCLGHIVSMMIVAKKKNLEYFIWYLCSCICGSTVSLTNVAILAHLSYLDRQRKCSN